MTLKRRSIIKQTLHLQNNRHRFTEQALGNYDRHKNGVVFGRFPTADHHSSLLWSPRALTRLWRWLSELQRGDEEQSLGKVLHNLTSLPGLYTPEDNCNAQFWV